MILCPSKIKGGVPVSAKRRFGSQNSFSLKGEFGVPLRIVCDGLGA